MAYSSSSVSFNKYCGALEWQNAVFLWVNVQEGDHAEYANKLYDGGRRFSWFGGSKMDEGTPVVQRLLGRRRDDFILLFVRFEKESYVCLGRLEVFSSDVSRRPVQIIWNLIDFEKVVKTHVFVRVLKVLRS